MNHLNIGQINHSSDGKSSGSFLLNNDFNILEY